MKKKIFGLSTAVLMLLGLMACKAATGVPTLGNKETGTCARPRWF